MDKPEEMTAAAFALLDDELKESLPADSADPGPLFFLHDDNCPSFCDYACGGVFVFVVG